MQSGNSTYINTDSIRAVLNSLHSGSVDEELLRPLQNLFVVNQAALSANYPSSEHQKLFIIQDIVIDIITYALVEVRKRFDLTTFENESHQDARISLKRDSLSHSTELLGYSILYYMYVMSDLELHTDDIAQCVNLAERTIRRYRDQAVLKVTKELWRRELDARQEFHHKRVVNKIKYIDANNYILREPMLGDILKAINIDNDGVAYIYGDFGTGKTILVKQCVTELLKSTKIDDVIWISNPTSLTEVTEYLSQHYELNNNQELETLFNTLNVIVVIDDADTFVQRTDSLSCFFEYLKGFNPLYNE